MVDLKLKTKIEDSAEQLRIYLEGIECMVKLDDYLIDDECGGFIRTILYAENRLPKCVGMLTVTLDNLMGYTRLHGFAREGRGSGMEESLREAFHDFLL